MALKPTIPANEPAFIHIDLHFILANPQSLKMKTGCDGCAYMQKARNLGVKAFTDKIQQDCINYTPAADGGAHR